MKKRNLSGPSSPAREFRDRIEQETGVILSVKQAQALLRIASSIDVTAQKVSRILKEAGYMESLAGGKATRIATYIRPAVEESPANIHTSDLPFGSDSLAIFQSLIGDKKEALARSLLTADTIHPVFPPSITDSFTRAIIKPIAISKRAKLGLEQLHLEYFEEALVNFYRAIQEDPNDIHAWFGMAKADALRANWRRACKSCEKLLECDALDDAFRTEVEDFLQKLPVENPKEVIDAETQNEINQYRQKGERHFQAKRWLQAVQAFMKVRTREKGEGLTSVYLQIAQAFLGEARETRQELMYTNARRFFNSYISSGGKQTEEVTSSIKECNEILGEEKYDGRYHWEDAYEEDEQ